MPTVFERLYSGELPCARVYADEKAAAALRP